MIESVIGFLLQDEPWRERAACKDAPRHLFFPVRGQSKEAAKSICRKCPVKKPCEQYAIKTGSSGIWGGKLFKVSGGMVLAEDKQKSA